MTRFMARDSACATFGCLEMARAPRRIGARKGFVRVNNNVAQDWIVWVISDGTEPTITRMGLQYDPIRDVLAGSVETPASETGKVIVVVAPVAPATAESAIYRVWAAQ